MIYATFYCEKHILFATVCHTIVIFENAIPFTSILVQSHPELPIGLGLVNWIVDDRNYGGKEV